MMDIMRFLKVERQAEHKGGCFFAPAELSQLAPFLPPGLPEQVVQWMVDVGKGLVAKNIALMVGPPGSMKAALTRLAAAQAGREVASMSMLAGDASLLGRRGPGLVLTADATDGSGDGASTDAVRLVARSHPKVPVLVACTSELHGRVVELGRGAIVFRVGPPSHEHLLRYAAHLLQAQGLDPRMAGGVVSRCSPDFNQVESIIALNRCGVSDAAPVVAFTKDPRREALTVIAEHMLSGLRADVASMCKDFQCEAGLFAALVAENYIDAAADVHRAALAAEHISAGDTMEAALYAAQCWSMHDSWAFQAAVLPCWHVRRCAKGTEPRFSKLLSLFSNAAQRNTRMVQVRDILAARARHLQCPCLEQGRAIATMLWDLLRLGRRTAVAELLARHGIPPDLAHHLARMAGKAQYKASHHKVLRGCAVQHSKAT